MVTSKTNSTLLAYYLLTETIITTYYAAKMDSQTCAPHENAFSFLRINFRILQSFSVVSF